MQFQNPFPSNIPITKKFFEQNYLTVFSVLFALIIIASIVIFFIATDTESVRNDQKMMEPFDTAAALKVRDILDARASRLNELRAAKPSAQDPF